ncbi:M16 family metallopeptidase [Lewinella sp. LCG006]|uniref:M16 family metallopeptidase n=1 Tax=Lewinella sp. LCG006 TaxID=3231911 RepID=UPI00345FF4DD
MKKSSNNWRIKNSICLLVGCSVLSVLYGQNATDNWQHVLPVDTTIQQGVLANGLNYFIRPNNEPRQRAELRLIIKAGSLQEEEDQLGVAHFVEHMAFNGTAKFAQNTLIDFIERNGSRFGADLNAYTSFAETVYQLQVQTDSLALVDTALQVLAEWSNKVTFDPEEVDKERGVIISEWRSSLSSSQRLQMQAYQTLLAGSRYAQRLPIGSPELIDTVPAQRLIDFYQRWYQPENMAIVVVGDVNAAWVEKKIEAYFSTLSNQNFQKATPYPLNTTPTRRYLLATDEEAAFTRWEITFQLEPQKNDLSLGTLNYQLQRSLFGSLLNKRLAKLKETAIPPFTFAYSGFAALPGNYHSYRLSALGTADKTEEALRTVMEETRRVIIHGFSEQELAIEKKAILEQYEQMVKELDKRSSSSIASGIKNAFLEGISMVDLNALPAVVADCLDNISSVALQELAEKALAAEVQNIIITTNSELAPTLPDSAAFYQLLDKLLVIEPDALEETGTQGPLFAASLPSQNAQALDRDTTLQISSFELSNGVKIFLKPTDFKNDEIRFMGFSPGGIDLYEDEDYPSARHALSILDQSGLDTFRESELLQLLSDRRVSVNPYVGSLEEGISGSSNQEDIETMFQLIYLYFTRPRFDSLALAAYQKRQIDIYDRLDEDPRTAFGRMVIDKKYDYHLRRPSFSIDEFAAIDLSRAESIYRERFANAADFCFVFVGNFAPDSLLDLATRYLGNLPANKQDSEQWQDRGLRLSNTPIDTTVIAGQTPKAEVILEWHGEFPYEDRETRLHFSALRELLSFRLREKLREEMGGVYGVRVNMRMQPIPDALHHTSIRFNAAPEEVDSLIAKVYEEINALAAGDIRLGDLEKIKASRAKSYEEAIRSNGFWLGQIAQCIRMKYDFERLYPDYYQQQLDLLDAGKFGAIAQQYLLGATHFKFVLLPTT